jgi:peptide/nickel transport system ATP-binding protein/oligopeptide transport system ATP-binding protein
MNATLVGLSNLTKYFTQGGLLQPKNGIVKAVDGVSFEIVQNETLGLVGESGCGKTTVGRLVLGLIKPDAGQVWFQGRNIFETSKKEMRALRRNMQVVFQDPFSSLDPRMMVKDIVAEPLRVHGISAKEGLKQNVLDLLERVGLEPEHMTRYPHEFSGGQRQRIVIARALALNPKFIVLDEPTSALDVSVQARILNDLQDIQEKLDLTFLFISHNLSVMKHMSDRIAVMYIGKIVEIAPSEELFVNAIHPYTEALLSSVPRLTSENGHTRTILHGEVPSAIDPPRGCRFHPRCPYAAEDCSKSEPKLMEVRKGHSVACPVRL